MKISTKLIAAAITTTVVLFARQYAVGTAEICKPANGYFDFNLSDSAIPKNLMCVNGGWVLYRPNGDFTAVEGRCSCVNENPNTNNSQNIEDIITITPEGNVVIDAPKVTIKGSLYLDGRNGNGLDRVADLHLDTILGDSQIYFGQQQNGFWMSNAITIGHRAGEGIVFHTVHRTNDGNYIQGDLLFTDGVLRSNTEGEFKGKAYIDNRCK